ncbi:unnamed protein product, partial [Prorocentrum cordatum]
SLLVVLDRVAAGHPRWRSQAAGGMPGASASSGPTGWTGAWPAGLKPGSRVRLEGLTAEEARFNGVSGTLRGADRDGSRLLVEVRGEARMFRPKHVAALEGQHRRAPATTSARILTGPILGPGSE